MKLPAGVTVNPAAAGGLTGCTEAEMGMGKAGAPACPASSKIGEVRIETPTLDEPLVGPIYQAAQGANPFGSLLALYMAPVSERYGVRIKLAGEVKADPATGQLTTSFLDNPQLPFTKLTMSLKGGSRAVLVNPPTCGTHTTAWSMTSHARPNVAVTGTDGFQVTSGADGGACPPAGAQAFAPGLEAGAVSPVAGAFSPLAVRLLRGDGQQQLTGLSVKLPQGMIGKLAGIPYCPDAVLARFPAGTNTPLGTAAGEIASPSCPAASQVGRVTVGAGAGSTPFYLQTGRAYLAGPYKGAPLSLAVVMAVKAGPFDLGNVMVRNAIHVDRRTAQLTVVSDPLPTILAGIPLRIRDLRVEVDRDGFAFTPSDCTADAVEATVAGDQGARAALSNRFQVADCARLGFAPKIGLRLAGRRQTTTGRHPAVRAVVRPGGIGAAAIRTARVKLPRSLALDPENAEALCEFADGTKPDLENHCPAGSKVGRARAKTALLDEDLVGDVYFVKNVRIDPETGNEIRTLPMIVAALRGQIAINLVGTSSTTRNGQLVATFANVPDAPIGRFNLNIQGGANGILAVTGSRSGDIDICDTRQRARAVMRGHNGKRINRRIGIRTPCARKANRAKR
ncbi:MAG: hypothetical protein GXY03_08630 [Solirubrobacterales bacterium]|nr:hypothetical protein [Solirubrobacterales bacterium]